MSPTANIVLLVLTRLALAPVMENRDDFSDSGHFIADPLQIDDNFRKRDVTRRYFEFGTCFPRIKSTRLSTNYSIELFTTAQIEGLRI